MSAEGQMLEHFKFTANNIFNHQENIVNPLFSMVIPVLYITQALSMATVKSLSPKDIILLIKTVSGCNCSHKLSCSVHGMVHLHLL